MLSDVVIARLTNNNACFDSTS